MRERTVLMLFMDLDETLVKTFAGEKVKNAHLRFKLNGQDYSTFLRPDAHLLRPHPFIVFTAGTCPYAKEVFNFLKKIGFKPLAYMCKKHLSPFQSAYPKFTGFLIDNSPVIATLKINKLPNVRWIKPKSFDYKNGQLRLLNDGLDFSKALDIVHLNRAIETLQ